MSQEKREQDIYELIDAGLGFIILESPKCNEGNNGVIYSFDWEILDDDLREAMKEVVRNSGDGEYVSKVLKAYMPGLGKTEYENLVFAHKALAGTEGDPNFARVPKPYLFRDIKLGHEAAEKLRRDTGQFVRPDRAEVFLMDFVPGDDLAMLTYRKLVETLPDAKAVLEKYGVTSKPNRTIAETVRDLDMQMLQLILSQEIGLERRSEKMMPGSAEEQALERRNAKKIFQRARRVGLKINPKAITQISNFLRLIHEKGLAHRDMHPRNVVIVGDPFDPNPATPIQTYVLDFGSAQRFQAGKYGEQRESLFVTSSGERRPNDEDIVAFMRGFIDESGKTDAPGKTLSDFRASQVKIFEKDAAIRRAAERRNREILSMLSGAATNLAAAEYLYRGGVTAKGDERKAMQFMSSLAEIVEKNPDRLVDVRAVLNLLKDSSTLSDAERRTIRKNMDSIG